MQVVDQLHYPLPAEPLTIAGCPNLPTQACAALPSGQTKQASGASAVLLLVEGGSQRVYCANVGAAQVWQGAAEAAGGGQGRCGYGCVARAAGAPDAAEQPGHLRVPACYHPPDAHPAMPLLLRCSACWRASLVLLIPSRPRASSSHGSTPSGARGCKGRETKLGALSVPAQPHCGETLVPPGAGAEATQACSCSAAPAGMPSCAAAVLQQLTAAPPCVLS